MVDDLKGFDAANTQITSWLGQKEKMISVLGPLAAEPVMIRSQIQQLEVNDASLLIRMLSSAVSRLTNGVFSIRWIPSCRIGDLEFGELEFSKIVSNSRVLDYDRAVVGSTPGCIAVKRLLRWRPAIAKGRHSQGPP